MSPRSTHSGRNRLVVMGALAALTTALPAIAARAPMRSATEADRRAAVDAGAGAINPTAAAGTSTAGPSSARAGPAGGPSPAATDWQPGPAIYGVGTTKNVPVTMSDGTVLRADVHFPTNPATGAPAAGPFPVILTQTPYGKAVGGTTGGGLSAGANPYLVQRGYIHAVADVRGTGASQGTFGLFDPIQATDGVTLVHWAADVAHSNGRVGTLGPSYLGVIQLMTAAEIGPDSPLKAIFPIVASNDPYRDLAFNGGMMNLEFDAAYLGLTAALNLVNPLIDYTGDPVDLLTTETQHLAGLFSWHLNLAGNVALGGDLAYDEAYWQARTPRALLDDVVANGIPAFLTGGWNDVFQRGEPLNYSGLQNAAAGRDVGQPMTPDQPVTGRYQLLMGPWYHITAGEGIDMNRLELQWFEQWLKDVPTGITDTDTPLHLFMLGAERWVDASHYPLTEANPTTLFFGEGGTLTTSPPAVEQGADTVVWTGVSSPCSGSTGQWSAGMIDLVLGSIGLTDTCAANDATTQLPPGAVTYTTAPFAEATVVAGPIDVTLFATSTRPETQWVATVQDVGPDGTSDPITAGTLLGSFRAVDEANTWWTPDGRPLVPFHPYTRASATPVTPGEVTRYDIEVFPTFAELAPGHRLRVTISTSDTPHQLPGPQQGINLLGGVYEVQRNAGAESFIEIPLAPASSFNTPCPICR